MFYLPFHVSDIRFSLIQERMLGHFSSLFFRILKKKETFFFKTPFIHFFEPCIPTRTCFKWALSLSRGILYGKTQSFVSPISSSHFSFPIWWFFPLSHVVNSSERKKLNQCFILTPLVKVPAHFASCNLSASITDVQTFLSDALIAAHFLEVWCELV